MTIFYSKPQSNNSINSQHTKSCPPSTFALIREAVSLGYIAYVTIRKKRLQQLSFHVDFNTQI